MCNIRLGLKWRFSVVLILMTVVFYFDCAETQIFVDKLFEAVNTKSYLPQPEQPTPTNRTDNHTRVEKDEQKKEEVRMTLKFKNTF